jgi:hypothetical protein
VSSVCPENCAPGGGSAVKQLSDVQVRAAFEILVGFEPDDDEVEEVRSLGGTSRALAEYLLGPWPIKMELDPLETTVDELDRAVRVAASRKEMRRLARWKRKRDDELFEELRRHDSEGFPDHHGNHPYRAPGP